MVQRLWAHTSSCLQSGPGPASILEPAWSSERIQASEEISERILSGGFFSSGTPPPPQSFSSLCPPHVTGRER